MKTYCKEAVPVPKKISENSNFYQNLDTKATRILTFLTFYMHSSSETEKKEDLHGNQYQNLDTKTTRILTFLTFCMNPGSETETDNKKTEDLVIRT